MFYTCWYFMCKPILFCAVWGALFCVIFNCVPEGDYIILTYLFKPFMTIQSINILFVYFWMWSWALAVQSQPISFDWITEKQKNANFCISNINFVLFMTLVCIFIADCSCENDGKCQNINLEGGGIGLICVCPLGYSGSRCEIAPCKYHFFPSSVNKQVINKSTTNSSGLWLIHHSLFLEFAVTKDIDLYYQLITALF